MYTGIDKATMKRSKILKGKIKGFKRYLNKSENPSGMIIKMLQDCQNELYILKEEHKIHVDNTYFE